MEYWSQVIKSQRARKSLSALNVFGLSVCVGAALLIMLYVRFELSFDSFHDGDRIYRVESRLYEGATLTDNWATTSFGHAPAMYREIPGIEQYVRVTAQDRGQEVTFGDRQFIEEQYCYTEPAFFDLFNFPILKGEKGGQLVRPNTMVITESAARRYFAGGDPIGKVLTFRTSSSEQHFEVTGVIADMHFAPTQRNYNNLISEKTDPSTVYITGNTVVDALKTTVRDNYEFKDETLAGMEWDKKRVIVMTAHRRENLGKPLENICRAVRRIVEKFDDVEVVYPVHLNPAVQNTVRSILGGVDRVKLIDPVNADELHNAIKRGFLVLTDSGGLQEEAPSLGKPVLVLRNETERPEAVEAGTVKIAGVDENNIFNMTCELLTDDAAYHEMAKAVNPYGDGYASERIVAAIIDKFSDK